MNHIEFIEKNVREELIRAGFPVTVAQGGAWQAIDLYKRMSRPVKKARSLMTAYASRNCGLKNRRQKLN